MGMRVGEALRDSCASLGLQYIFKASFDKANRSSGSSPRGPGIGEGLAHLGTIRDSVGVPVTTDIHLPEQAELAAPVIDLLQIPAFLCRQTDLLVAAADAAGKHGRAVNIKKGQFVSPAEMEGPVRKVRGAGCDRVLITERGTFFGYHRLVNDFVGLGDLLEGDAPVVFDATHSTQAPGGVGQDGRIVSGGRRERVELLARAAVAAGVDAVFLEVHPDPDRAMSDAASQVPLERAGELLASLTALRAAMPA